MAVPVLIVLFVLGLGTAPDPPLAPSDQPVAIRGQLVDPEEKPTIGAEIRVKRQDQMMSRRDWYPESWVPPAVVAADENGAFSASDLKGSVFRLRIAVPGRATQTLGDIPGGAALRIHLRDGEALGGRVLGSTGHPLAGASVVACDRGALDFGVESCPSVLTGEEGAFAFTDLPAGPLELRAHAAGHAVSEILAIDLPLTADRAGPLVRLGPGARIEGRVIDDDGRPLEGVRVWSTPLVLDVEVLRPATTWPVFSDAEGRFVLPGVAAGESYTVGAHRSDRAEARSKPLAIEAGKDLGGIEIRMPEPAILHLRPVDPEGRLIESFQVLLRKSGADARYDEGLDGRFILREETRFEVRVPEPERLDLLFLPQGYTEFERTGLELSSGGVLDLGTIELERGGTIEGRVTDLADVPIAQATVEGVWFGRSGPRLREIRTDESGSYVLAGLGTGPIDVEARAEGHAPAKRESVEPGERVDFRLEATGSLAGRVEFERGGSPPGFRILLHMEAENARPARDDLEWSFSTTDGSYRIEDLAPARYTVEARAEAHAPGKVAGVVVESGQSATAETIVLEDGLKLGGRVLAALDDRPLQGVGIEAKLDGGPLQESDTGSVHDTTSTDENGRFALDSLGPGSYAVRARHPEYAMTQKTVVLESDVAADDLVLRLHGGGRLSGTVRDIEGRPATGHRILAARSMLEVDDARTTLTDSAGSYEIPRLPPGSYQIAHFHGLRLETKTAVIRDGDLTVVDFGDAPPIRLYGSVLRGVEPLPGTGLFFSESDSVMNLDALKFTTADSAGRYEIGLERPGVYRVVVGKPGGAGGGSTVEIDVPDEEEVLRDILLETDGISGTVRGAEGDPLSGAAVSARRDGAAPSAGEVMQVAETDGVGRYSIQGLEAGLYRVTAVAAGHRVGSLYPVALDAGERVEGVDLRLERGETLRGVVLDPQGQGARGAFVFAAPSGGASALSATSATTDVNGAFQITLPAEGPIDLTAIGAGHAPARLLGAVPDEEPLTLRMTRGGTLRVRVVGADREPRAGVSLEARAVPGFLASDMAQIIGPPPSTDSAGLSVIPHLYAGDYEVRVVGESWTPPARIVVSEGVETLIMIELP